MNKKAKPKVVMLTREEGKKLLDEQAKLYLNMNGTEFVRKWTAKEIKNPDRPEVMRVAFLLPFGG